jgi:AraC-like DNA-binding protein
LNDRAAGFIDRMAAGAGIAGGQPITCGQGRTRPQPCRIGHAGFMENRGESREGRMNRFALDPLSEVLQTVRMTGGVFLDGRFTAPWCVMSQVELAECRPHLDRALQIIAYHHVIEGRMRVELEDGEVLEVPAGETVLLPRNDPHKLGSAADLPPTSAGALIQPGIAGGLAQIVLGGGGASTHIICGFLGSDQFRNPVIETLPRVLKIATAPAGSSSLIESSMRFATQSLMKGEIGESSVMCRLSELLFVEAVRRYAAALPAGQAGWLAGMRDFQVSRALALIHGKPNHPWTAEALAGEVALSRSTFADRFAQLIGVPPKRYLLQWRLQVAKEKLRHGNAAIAQVAHEVGYEAEAAFNRAFKREFGLPPSAWRKSMQAPETRGVEP